MFEIEVQNETTQTQQTIRFVAVPRIGEGVRLQDVNGFWTSYDVLDVWYQRSAFGDVWVPYMHVRKSEEVASGPAGGGDYERVPPPTPGEAEIEARSAA